MIRKETFGVDVMTFASERKQIVKDYELKLQPHVADALKRLGLSGWQVPIVRATLEVFDESARFELDEWNPIVDDMRDAFEHEVSEALSKTKQYQDEKFDVEVEKLSRWLATAAVNAGVEAATTSDPDELVGLEWITMEDDRVRSSHTEAAGQVVPTGQPFSVGDSELLYPGQPVGDPKNWINCRCVVRPTMLSDASSRTITASVASDIAAEENPPAGEVKNTSSVIVALPAASEGLDQISSEDQPHVTLLWLGDAAAFDPTDIKATLDAYVSAFTSGPVTDAINGNATLGADKAMVVLLDAENLANIRGAILADVNVRAVHDGVEQFPTWIPHLTLGYPEAPPLGELSADQITFDRIALWHGDEKTEYVLGGKPEEQVAIVAAVEDPITDPSAEETGPDGEPVWIPDEEAAPPVPFHGVAAPEGRVSGDRRSFAVGSLSHRELPLPLTAMFINDEAHKGAKVGAGRIDKIWKDENNLVWYEGVFDYSETGYETLRLVAEGMWRGVSVDLDMGEGSITELPDGRESMELTAGRISAITVCAIPAFAEAFIALGPYDPALYADAPAETDGIPTDSQAAALTDKATFEVVPPKTKDGPGWITHPEPTKDITSYWVTGPGAAKIGWGAPGDFNRCRVQLAKYVQNPEWLAGLCANLHYRALGVWPGRSSHSGRTEEMALTADAKGQEGAFALVASASQVLSADLFRKPELDKLTALQINEETGHVYGHIAAWGTCHIGYSNECKDTPRSSTDYAYFHTGEVVTDAGMVAVGQLTLGGGHADMNKTMRAAIAHYDNVTAAIADVCAYEDEFGVVVSGVLREGLDSKTLRAARAASYSGDWRSVVVNGQSQLEMIAALAVNVPGFPVPRTALAASAGHDTAMVAAGIVMDGVEPLNETADEERANRLALIKATARRLNVASLNNKIKTLKGV
jgi:hypothetical protein